jgi:putative intracellular protease/amidase
VLKVLDKQAGADYSSPMQPFDDYSITGGRLITGANPQSARSAAERALKAFDELPTAQGRDRQSAGRAEGVSSTA